MAQNENEKLTLAMVSVSDMEVMREFLETIAAVRNEYPDTSLEEFESHYQELCDNVHDIYEKYSHTENVDIDLSDVAVEKLKEQGLV